MGYERALKQLRKGEATGRDPKRRAEVAGDRWNQPTIRYGRTSSSPSLKRSVIVVGLGRRRNCAKHGEKRVLDFAPAGRHLPLGFLVVGVGIDHAHDLCYFGRGFFVGHGAILSFALRLPRIQPDISRVHRQVARSPLFICLGYLAHDQRALDPHSLGMLLSDCFLGGVVARRRHLAVPLRQPAVGLLRLHGCDFIQPRAGLLLRTGGRPEHQCERNEINDLRAF